MKVRATQDGHYGGYYRHGPIETDQGSIPGEVFEIDEKPFVQRDEQGNPVQEMEPTGAVDERGNKTFKLAWVMENGKIKKDKDGQPIPKHKITTFFAPEWMVRVPDDTEVTYDYPPFEVPKAYQVKKQKPGKTVALPADVAAAAGVESASGIESVI